MKIAKWMTTRKDDVMKIVYENAVPLVREKEPQTAEEVEHIIKLLKKYKAMNEQI